MSLASLIFMLKFIAFIIIFRALTLFKVAQHSFERNGKFAIYRSSVFF
jgi:hypothetical protein